MKSFFIIGLLAATAVLGSCKKEENRLIGDWDDNIQLSQKTAQFKAVGDSVIITTKGTEWLLSYVNVDETCYSPAGNMHAYSYIFDMACFIVERRNKTTLIIKLNANPLSTTRVVKVGLEDGDYFDSVTITQEASE